VILLGACGLPPGGDANAYRSNAAGAGTRSAATENGLVEAGATPGGTVYYLTMRPAESLDPQRTVITRDLADLGRLVYRSLVQFPVTEDPERATTPVPDLATDTGTSEHGGTQWSFTLKDGVTWQDGKDVTCEDLRHGLSRAFATDVLTGRPTYPLVYLDVPRRQGTATYKGPYTKHGQTDFDKAVTCNGRTITYRFNRPWHDFPLAIASLRVFDPYRADQDKRDRSNFSVFSDGPYRLEGAWRKGRGGTFVRNANYDATTDGVRRALPDKIVFVEGLPDEIITQRMIADSGNDKTAVTDRVVPPDLFGQVTGAVADRATLVASPSVTYLLPNVSRMPNPKVRQALAMATDKAAYSAALGGDRVSRPARSIINPLVPGYHVNPGFPAPDTGDVDGARRLLQEAGVTLPYPIKVFYPGGSPLLDNAMAALKKGWDKAGFATTLDPLGPMAAFGVDPKLDVVCTSGSADWPAISAVIPPLFDSRLVDVTAMWFEPTYRLSTSKAVDTMIDDATAVGDLRQQAKAYATIDEQLGKDIAYIPIDIAMLYFLHGSRVTGYTNSPATNLYVDLGAIGVAK
jgi:peptide/nickel transport system substrate-binding protein